MPFVEVTLGGFDGGAIGWDTHQQNFDGVQQAQRGARPGVGHADGRPATARAARHDAASSGWASSAARRRSTRKRAATTSPTPGPRCWPAAASGAARSSAAPVPTATKVEDRPVSVPDFLATVCLALGIDPLKQNQSNVGRPIRIVDKVAKPIQELLS